jgi:hypothetical protein
MRMTTSSVFAFFIALLLSSCKSAPKTSTGGPSLQETQVWMGSFAASRAMMASFELNDCSAKEYVGNYVVSVSFKDLDPNTTVIGNAPTLAYSPTLPTWTARAMTTNDLDKVVVYEHDDKNKQHAQNNLDILFRDREDADRFANALRQAIKLCGGKASPF